MKQTSADYTFGLASLEIVLLLLGAFLLGMLLCWLLRKLGICCASHALNTREPSLSDTSHTTHSSTTREGQRTPREFPGNDLKGGGYTADINSLLRNPEPPAPSAPSRHEVSSIPPNLTSVTLGHKDDLKKLEGIGPKLEQVLNASGVRNFAQLASMTPEEIKPILEAAGNQFKMHDPKSWPYQAELANKGEWERLKEYQNLLISGRV
ncbi:hypothetical protein [Thiothrix subterranea]|uniref:DUF4332 domain-containing protein n=1 Tax=Thiothrix subterranea TaxID=2735563 RepID=A0AA51MJF6_9GAMM|nr:hypothetical protein [Thiothrix subterranea]MDQ5768158.1 hypothetical protein [Thiothrix subterranea]WML85338.1 hypothetical protein RCG00_13645 [Thiothrix subterranea]